MATDITVREWLKLMKIWSSLNGRKHYTLGAVEGARADRITMWYETGQQDFSHYTEHLYVYGALTCYRYVSRKTYDIASELFKGQEVVDFGGTPFGAVRMMANGITSVTNVNLPGYQRDFESWVNNRKDLGILQGLAERYNSSVARNAITSEYFEHFKEPLLEFKRISSMGFSQIFWRESFCTKRYGHYIPIVIDGKEYTEPALATNAFVEAIRNAGFSVERLRHSCFLATRV